MNDIAAVIAKDAPKRKRGRPATGGPDPMLGFRAPCEVVYSLRREACLRGVNPSVVIREALTQFLANLEAHREAA
jgi:hypothetical protein